MKKGVKSELKYSTSTIALAFEAITMLNEGDLKLRLGRYSFGLIFEDHGSKARWAASARQTIEAKTPSALNQVVEDVAREGPESTVFLNSLKADGFDVSEKGQIVPLLVTKVTPAKEESVLEELLSSLSWDQTKAHLSEGVSSYEHGNWAAANAQFRTFLEDVFNQIAKSRGIGKSGVRQGVLYRRMGFLVRKKAKW